MLKQKPAWLETFLAYHPKQVEGKKPLRFRNRVTIYLAIISAGIFVIYMGAKSF